MGCNFGNSRSRVDVSASVGAFTSPFITDYPALLLTASLVPLHGSAFIFYASLVLKQRDSMGCNWPTISSNLSEDFKMSHYLTLL